MKDDGVALAQIIERVERIEGSGIDRERFLKDPFAQDAIIRNLEVIGEVVKQRLSSQAQDFAPTIPWKKIAGFQHIAIHGCDQLDPSVVWRVVEVELPDLRRAARKILRRLERSRDGPKGTT